MAPLEPGPRSICGLCRPSSRLMRSSSCVGDGMIELRGAEAHAVGFSCTLRLMPEKG